MNCELAAISIAIKHLTLSYTVEMVPSAGSGYSLAGSPYVPDVRLLLFEKEITALRAKAVGMKTGA